MRTRPPPTRTRRLALATAATVTVYKGSLVGRSDNNASEDTGHLRVTHHHNWFDNVNSRMGAQMLVENNVFRTTTDTPTCAATTLREPPPRSRGWAPSPPRPSRVSSPR